MSHIVGEAVLRNVTNLVSESQKNAMYPFGTFVFSRDDGKVCFHDGVTRGGLWCFQGSPANTTITAVAGSGIIITQNGNSYSVDLDLCAMSGPTQPVANAAKLLACNAFGKLIAVPPYINAVVNTPPVVNNDLFSTPKNMPISNTVAANDSDADNDTLVYALISPVPPTQGALIFNANGTYVFTPATNFIGQVQFTYQASDGKGGIGTAIVTINVTATNTAPNAVNDTYSTSFNTPYSGSLKTNDTDPENDPLTGYVLVTNPTKGTVSLSTNGSFTYTPNTGSTGTDTFTYKMYDVNGAVSNVATVTLIVQNAINLAPVATNDNAVALYGTPVTITVLANDTDDNNAIVSVQIVNTPSGGTATVNASNQVVFTPASGFSGTATVQYQVTDSGGLQSNIATISITVAAPTNNITTVADKLYVTAFYDTLYPTTNAVGGHVAVPKTINPLVNDTDVGNTLQITNAALTSGAGSVTFTANSVTFTPAKVLTQNKVNNPSAPAEDYTINNAAAENDGIITYTVTNSIGQTKTGTIAVLVGTPQYNSFFDVYVQTDWTDGTSVNDGTNP